MKNVELSVLSDLRKNLIFEKNKSIFKWNDCNILYKTLWFAVKNPVDVEFCEEARKSYYKYFCFINPNDKDCVLDLDKLNLTADVMNGWWGGFKKMFSMKQSYTRKKLFEKLFTPVKNPNKIYPHSTNSECLIILNNHFFGESDEDKENYVTLETFNAFLSFLYVVYTIGNVTPTAINPRANDLDTWEYKLNNHPLRWLRIFYPDDSYPEKFSGPITNTFLRYCSNYYFTDYIDTAKNTPNTEWNAYANDFKTYAKDYFSSRFDLIIRRGYRILTPADKIDESKIEDLKKSIISLV